MLEDSSSSSALDPSDVSFNLAPGELELSDELLSALLRRIRAIAARFNSEHADENVSSSSSSSWVLFGSVHEAVRQRMLHSLSIEMKKTATVGPELDWEFCGKWLFRVEDLSSSSPSSSEVDQSLPPTKMKLRWDKVRREDVKLVQSRTRILRTE